MIIEDIKNSLRNALYNMDNTLIFHFEEAKTTDFPYAILNIKDFYLEYFSSGNKERHDYSFELVFAKSKENKIIDLINFQKQISDTLLPTIKVLNKKLTLDEVKFGINGKQLIMNFNLTFYTYETENEEIMQTLDLTIKEDKNAWYPANFYGNL